MGLPGPNTGNLEDLEKRFSDDILKIELSGPDHHHLSVVDVPGLFHSKTKLTIICTSLIARPYQISDRRRPGNHSEAY